MIQKEAQVMKMRGNSRLKNALLRVAAVLLMMGAVVAPVASLASTQPRDNDSNAIMWGGCYTKQECQGKISKGDGHNSAANLQKIYYQEDRGITAASFAASSTVDGLVYKDGRVTVGGKVVATGARSVGRTYKDGSVKSGSVWERPTSVSFAADSIPAYVNMEGGTFRYFVIKSCGNPGRATPVKKPTPSPSPSKSPTPTPSVSVSPSPTPIDFKCVALTPTHPDKDKNPSLFRFTVTPEVSKGVTITGYRFSFSDGTPVVDTPADRPYVERTVKSGSLKVQAQVKTSAGITQTSEACSATVQVTTSPSPSGAVLGATLPAAGPAAALGGIAGVSAIAWTTRAYLRSRKSLLDALRKPKSEQ